ncbi:hypothetical protein [uncultured Anaerococcus sp.]|uniref:hypothetical protein n=1 Tax=uncultured Anaerococcus sp. TaxID=293428 RepID=UPI0025D70F5D|nr:hypothetical protein [uncultured Anaerococcus sp.]
MARNTTRQRRDNRERPSPSRERVDRTRRRKAREKKRRRRTFGPYILILILLMTSIFFVARSISHNVDRTVARIESAIKNDDELFMKENMDRIDLIFEVLKKSYSEDEVKQKDFVKNNFKNLDIKVLNKLDIDGGKEISLRISNVNYVEEFDKVKNIEEINQHEEYMRKLSASDANLKNTDAKIFLKKKLFGYDIYESREFINGIIGGALDLVNESK